MACGLTAWALASVNLGLHADNNQSGFGDSAPPPFELDTQDSSPYGAGDSDEFTLDTGGDNGAPKTGLGDSPWPGFI